MYMKYKENWYIRHWDHYIEHMDDGKCTRPTGHTQEWLAFYSFLGRLCWKFAFSKLDTMR